MDFELAHAEPMTFEERMKGEKAMVGYPVSGHPLDGMEDFIVKKSKNIARVQSWLEKLHNPEAVTEEDLEKIHQNPENPTQTKNTESTDTAISPENNTETEEKTETSKEKKKTEKKDEEKATLIGLVSEVHHIPTKSGQMMIIAVVQSVGFDFRVIVFGRDYDIYKEKLIEDTIVVVDGKLRFDEERGEVSLSPITPYYKTGEKVVSNSVKTFTITQFQDFVESSGVSIATGKPIQKHVIHVPPFWSRDDLLDLKNFLLSEPSGEIEIILSIK